MLLREVGFLVIDEADRMFDMGFIDDLRRLIRYLPPASERQTFLFSATLGLRVKDLAWEYMTSPHEIVIEPENVTVDLVTQELHHVGSHEKMGLLLGILERDRPESAIIFANQKYMVEEISRRLRINGVENEYIMGDLPQSKRLDIIDRLKAGRLRILVATDVAARGLDVEALDLVINYDVPEDAESYVHRIGRTARAGKAGKAITLACEKFVFGLPAIEKFIGKKIPVSSFDSSIMLEDRSAGMRFGRGARDFQARSGRGPTPREGPRREGPRRDGPRREGPPRGREGGRPGRDARPVHVERRLTREESPHREEQRPRPPHRDQSVEAAGADRDGPNPYNLSSEERMARYKEKYAAEAAGQGGTRQAGPNRPNPRNESRRPEGRGPSAPQTPRRSGQPGPHGQRRPEEIRGPGRDPNLPKGPRPEGPKQQRPDITKPRPQQPAATTIPVAPEKKPGLLGRIKKLFGGK
jgi:ATP-dependent RNA helicase RhlB